MYKRRNIFILLLLIVPVLIYAMKWEALLWYSLNNWLVSDSEASQLHLNDYQVVIDGKAIADVDDLSGLTYNLQSNTLYSVLNGQPLIIEMDTTGNILRQITVSGVGDMEGISHIEGNAYLIVDEKDQRLLWVEIDADTTVLDVADAPSISLVLKGQRNKGFEGVSWDEVNQRVLLVQERNPLRVVALTGLQDGIANANKLVIQELRTQKHQRLWLRDLSSITHDRHAGNLIFLSDESRMVVEYDLQNDGVSYLNLRRGAHGLKASIPQAEGVAIGPDNAVYIVSEPNLFYKFAAATAE